MPYLWQLHHALVGHWGSDSALVILIMPDVVQTAIRSRCFSSMVPCLVRHVLFLLSDTHSNLYIVHPGQLQGLMYYKLFYYYYYSTTYIIINHYDNELIIMIMNW